MWWKLTSETKGVRRTQRFRRVIIASGHHSLPSIPTFPGQETFNGQITHRYLTPPLVITWVASHLITLLNHIV
jgi:hypothetical protein